ncbi:MAG: hypothetical protein OEU97_07125 [Dehalococcoidia bacterium]|nr:hypothetical protein [Dehalococcoidia bacterium]MDH4299891.1 hypothetical protein [Dehalococcoidia bacterium]MDH4368074.1 hypothetical protein [Dehalococcoidia bacterium]
MRRRTDPNWLDKLKLGVRKQLGMSVFICGNCKWNWRSACHRPERPNATWCPDYVKKGK